MYLGKPGNLVEIPDPKPGVTASASKNGGTHVTLGGRNRTDYPGSTAREYKLSWGGGPNYLSPEEYDILEQYYEGIGPWVLHPYSKYGRWNYASPSYIPWAPAYTGSQAYRFLPQSGLYSGVGTPVMAGQNWSFQASVLLASGTGVTLSSFLDWYKADKTTLISSTTGPTGTPSSTAWNLSVNGTAPALSAYVVPRLTGTVNSGSVYSMSKVQLEIGQATTPLRGRGCPIVSFNDLTLEYNFAFQLSADATFIDVS
jgi:hypothetical protein